MRTVGLATLILHGIPPPHLSAVVSGLLRENPPKRRNTNSRNRVTANVPLVAPQTIFEGRI